MKILSLISKNNLKKNSIDTKFVEVENKNKKSEKQWKEKEEWAFLKEMMRRWEEKKSDPATNMDAFLEFMKPRVLCDFSKFN